MGDAWAEFVPFLSFDVEIRKIICTTNAIESVNARIRRAVKVRGHADGQHEALAKQFACGHCGGILTTSMPVPARISAAGASGASKARMTAPTSGSR